MIDTRRLAFPALVLFAAFSAGTTVAQGGDWFPARRLWDYKRFDPAAGDCGDPQNPAANFGRCGPMDGPVFNSFMNTPSYGFEPAFLDASLATATARGSFKDELKVESGRGLLTLRIYVDNNANEDFGARTTADGTTIRVSLPKGPGKVLRARAYIGAQNAQPNSVEDTVDIVSPNKFSLEYVQGSAVQYQQSGPRDLDDDIVASGVGLGSGDDPGVY